MSDVNAFQNLGICLGDREAHCRKCNNHYYAAGGLLRMPCPDCDPDGKRVGPRDVSLLLVS